MIQESEYFSRRTQMAKKLKKNSIALLCSANPKIRSNDTEYPYRQNSNFYYLTGFEEERSALVFIKRKEGVEILLFVQPKDPQKELWSGKVLGVKEARKRFLVDKVYSIEKFERVIKEKVGGIGDFYYEFEESVEPIKILQKLSKNGYTRHNLSKLVEKMRLIKSQSEIELIKKGMQITKEAHHKAMQLKKEDMMEYELQAEFEYIFKKNGAYSDAYTTIVAGGDNANTLHYIKNSDRLQDGDLILIDAGCEYRYYATDITRTIPVNGKFTQAQKELYTLVLDVEKKIISMVRPGVLRSRLQKEAERMLCEGMVRLGILKGSVKKLIKKQKHKRYFPHGIGHYMGIDVHDPSPYKTKKLKEIPLKEGMILTIEPGVYLPKEDTTIPKRYRGIGIRIEDDILVTKEGYENLSASIVKEIEEIEALYSSS
ncbi:Xaa-Pro aminopeptidase [hydrothermal vent metagenome]|uniref:Xaa-Pro aminopeptidase n=1 Tax=hydrothermal vent metagenome TaxID=652676 RepID=A0A1W1BS06_9ZZZZ